MVVGAGRSGTSLVAGLLADAGLTTGYTLIPPSEANPTGFHEDVDVNVLNDELLAPFLGPDHHGSGTRLAWLAALDAGVEPVADAEQRARMAHLIRDRPFCVKDPRLCHTLDAWRPVLPADVAYLAVFRHPASVIRSVQDWARRDPSYFADFDAGDAQLHRTWASAYTRIIEHHSDDGDWTFVDADALVLTADTGPLSAAIGGPVPTARIDGGLRRSHREGVPVPDALAELYAELVARARSSDPRSAPPGGR